MQTKKRSRVRRLSTLPLHLMLLPAVILLLIYSYGPMFGLTMAFQNYSPAKGLMGSKWVGFANFQYVFHLPTFIGVIGNTLFISLNEIILGQVFAIALAMLINEARKSVFTRTVQTVVYLPHFLSWVIVGGIFLDFLAVDGMLNKLLNAMGLKSIYFLGNARAFPWVLICTHLWKEIGFATIVYIAALTGIDPGLYEAAEIDGAGRMRKIIHISVPGILPIVILVAVLNMGSILNAGFEQVLVMYNPLVYSTGDIIDTFVYRLGITQAQYSVSTAVGIFKSCVSLVLVGASYLFAYKFANYQIF